MVGLLSKNMVSEPPTGCLWVVALVTFVVQVWTLDVESKVVEEVEQNFEAHQKLDDIYAQLNVVFVEPLKTNGKNLGTSGD